MYADSITLLVQVDWKSEENRPVKPKLLGTKVYKEYDVKDILDYIDWNPFFQVSAPHYSQSSLEYPL